MKTAEFKNSIRKRIKNITDYYTYGYGKAKLNGKSMRNKTILHICRRATKRRVKRLELKFYLNLD